MGISAFDDKLYKVTLTFNFTSLSLSMSFLYLPSIDTSHMSYTSRTKLNLLPDLMIYVWNDMIRKFCIRLAYAYSFLMSRHKGTFQVIF